MEKVENPTVTRVKNNFSIENILSRPENCESQRRPMRQNPFQNNHVLFHANQVNNYPNIKSVNDKESGSKRNVSIVETRFDNIDNEDHETNSEAASDDGNSSVHSKWQTT